MKDKISEIKNILDKSNRKKYTTIEQFDFNPENIAIEKIQNKSG